MKPTAILTAALLLTPLATLRAADVTASAHVVKAEETGKPLTYRKFDTKEADGRVVSMTPVPSETVPRWARDVSQ